MFPPIAHVDYVTDPAASPDPIGFLLATLADPVSLLILVAGAVVVAGLVVAWARWRPLEGPRQRFVVHGQQYAEFVPWMIRLSVGLVLVGAGLSRVLFMPTLPASTILALLLTAAGFLILVGLAVRPAAIAALGGYLVARAWTISCAPHSRADRARVPRPRTSALVGSTTSCRSSSASGWVAPSPHRASPTSCSCTSRPSPRSSATS
jgi:hypothetical protein